MNFASTKTVRARKAHSCEECGRTIHPAETYHRTAGSYEGDFFTNVACGHCSVFRRYIDRADSNYCEGYFGGTGEWVANGYWSASDLPSTTFEQRLALYRMAQHFRDRWRDRAGELRPVPTDVSTNQEAVPTGAASLIQGDNQ